MATLLPPVRRALFYSMRFIVVLCAIPLCVEAQAPTRETAPAELVRTMAALDSALFTSYNRCELDTFASFWAPDVEFYHDQSGLTVGVQKLTDAVRANICGKVRRQLVPGTLEVYIMHGYGALATGVHRFYPAGPDQLEAMGEARFILLWRRDGGWKITRSISYDHHALPQSPAR
jgi:hypothetical protein